MKKFTIAVVLLIFTISSVDAQKFAFGTRIAPMISWSKVTPYEDNTTSYSNDGVRGGIALGPSMQYNFSEKFGLEVGFLFSWQGNKFNQTATLGVIDIDLNYKVKRQYLHIPVTVNGNIPIIDLLDVVMTFGAMPSVQLSGKCDITENKTGKEIKLDHKVPSIPVNFYLIAGAGALIHLTDDVGLSAGIKYNHGLIDAWDDDQSNLFVKKMTEKHHFVALDLGLYIKF